MISVLHRQRVLRRSLPSPLPSKPYVSRRSWERKADSRSPFDRRRTLRRQLVRGRCRRVPPPPPRSRLVSYANHRFSSAKPVAGLWAFLASLPRIETALAVLILVLVGLSLAVRPSLGSRAEPIAFPEDVEQEAALLQFAFPEENTAVSTARLPAPGIQRLVLTDYKVRGGDTLAGIAMNHGLNVDTLISFNAIRDARALREGMVLKVPNTNGLVYAVKRGNHLDGIAKLYGIPLNDLLDWNRLESSVIQPGQKLFIPGARLNEHDLNRVLGKLFIYPAIGRISSGFGIRLDPFTGVRRFHNGLDIVSDLDSPIQAAMSGRIAMLGYNSIYGKYIIMKHADGYQTLYGHLNRFQVDKGQNVAQGQVIGAMGSTGYSTGVHLHFSIFRRGEPVDPSKFLH